MFADEPGPRMVRFGFKAGKGGAHAARTMMLPELARLFESAGPGVGSGAARSAYRSAVVDANCLAKPTLKARKLTLRHLCDLYALDEEVCLFRVLRRLWNLDAAAQPLLALQIAVARDPLLRASVDAILGVKPGDLVTREAMEDLYDTWSGGRFSARSVQAIAQRVNGTWTQAGYLTGRVRKHRVPPVVTPVNVAYAAFQSWLAGRSGQRLFSGDWMRLLGLPEDRLLELAQAAARLGLLVLRRTGDVIEVRFPGYLTPGEEASKSDGA